MAGYGLLGEVLGHSFSPEIHTLLGDVPYDLFEVARGDLASFLETTDLQGMNVTIPYKKEVMRFLAEVSAEAESVGAVNTIVRDESGKKWRGYNTDVDGFRYMLDASGFSFEGKKGLILGDGGASAAVQYVLKERGAAYTVLTRRGEHRLEEAGKYADATFVVNATPVGMFPENGASPIDLSLLPNCACVLDLIYNPLRTRLLLDAKEGGMIAVNGLGMLVAQAKKSAELFLGRSLPDERIAQIEEVLRRRVENVVLIGMPGCGKTTVGKKLAASLHREFYDSDRAFREMYDMTPAECIEKEGEAFFREKETEVLRVLGMKSGAVIATGGGVVTREVNRDLLRQNGCIVWLRKDIKLLSTKNRPLSKGNLKELYEVRRPLYRSFADLTVDSVMNSTITMAKVQRAVAESSRNT